MSSTSPRSFIGSSSDLLFDEEDLNLLLPNNRVAANVVLGGDGGGIPDDSFYSFMTTPDTNDEESSLFSSSSPPANSKTSLSFSATPRDQNFRGTNSSEDKIFMEPSSSGITAPAPGSGSLHPPPHTPASHQLNGSDGLERGKKKKSMNKNGGEVSSSSSSGAPNNHQPPKGYTSKSDRHRQLTGQEEEDGRESWVTKHQRGGAIGAGVEEDQEVDENEVFLQNGGWSEGAVIVKNEEVEKKKERPAHACAYCGVSSPDCVLKCCCCGKYFCNSPCNSGGSMGSHVIFHLVRSHHNEVMLHPEGPLGRLLSSADCWLYIHSRTSPSVHV